MIPRVALRVVLTLYVFRVSARLAARDLKKLAHTKLTHTKLAYTLDFPFLKVIRRTKRHEKKKSAPQAPVHCGPKENGWIFCCLRRVNDLCSRLSFIGLTQRSAETMLHNAIPLSYFCLDNNENTQRKYITTHGNIFVTNTTFEILNISF